MRPRQPTESEQAEIAAALVVAQDLRPYYSRALRALTVLVAPGLGTVAVDRRWRLYLDLDWWRAQTARHRAGVIACHEIEHLLRGHHARGAWAGERARNVAGDLEIDDDADPADVPDPLRLHRALGVPQGCTLEQYLDLLDDECPRCSGGSGAGRPLEGELGADQAPGLQPEEIERLLDAVADDVRARGDAPAGIRVWADARARSARVDWRRELAAVLGAASRSAVAGRADWSRSRLHRRQQIGAPLRPAAVARPPKVSLVVDTSGSMGALGEAVIAEAWAICRAYDTRVIACDAAVTSVTRSVPRAWVGGGGTDLREAIALGSRAEVVVVLTDGETPWPPAVDRPVIVVAPPGATVPPWARHVELTP